MWSNALKRSRPFAAARWRRGRRRYTGCTMFVGASFRGGSVMVDGKSEDGRRWKEHVELGAACSEERETTLYTQV